MRRSKHLVLYGGLLAAALGILTMLPAIIKFGGVFAIRGDYINQTITRLINAKNMLTGGAAPLWNWKNFLGTAYTGAFSILLSFNAVCMLFPVSLMAYGSMVSLVLRWFVMGMTSTAFIKRFVCRDESALIGSLLYCFSGYAIVTLEFAAFYSTMAMFPLLLIAVEKRFTDDNYKGMMILASALNLMASSYLFIGSSLVLLVYALVRFFSCEEWRKNRRFSMILLCLAEYGIGVLICGFTVSAFIKSMLTTSRSTTMLASSEVATGSIKNLLIPKYLFDELAGIFLPVASSRVTTFFSSTNWFSMQAYIPVFGFGMCFASFLRFKFKDSFNIILAVLLLASFIPLLNNLSSFYANSYTRWWYALTLIMSVISVRMLDDLSDPLNFACSRKGLLAQWAAVIAIPLLYAAVYLLRDSHFGLVRSIIAVFFKHDYSNGIYEDIFRIYSVSVAVVLTGAFTYIVFRKNRAKSALPLVLVCIALFTMSFVMLSNSDSEKLFEVYNQVRSDKECKPLTSIVDKFYKSEKLVNDGPYSYRVDYPANILFNYAAVINQPGIGYYESTINTNSANFAVFADMCNDASDVYFYPHDSGNALRTLLSVKYFYNYYPDDESIIIPDGFTFAYNDKDTDVYENDYYIPFGFAYDSYVTETELYKLKESGCADVGTLLHTLAVEDGEEDYIKNYLPHCDDAASTGIASDTSARRACASTSFEGDSSGFTATITAEKTEVVFFSVPYDEGWRVTVDGEPCKLVRANIGFFALVVPEGEHTVKAVYHNAAIIPGVVISISGIAIATAYISVLGYVRKKKNANAVCQAYSQDERP